MDPGLLLILSKCDLLLLLEPASVGENEDHRTGARKDREPENDVPRNVPRMVTTVGVLHGVAFRTVLRVVRIIILAGASVSHFKN